MIIRPVTVVSVLGACAVGLGLYLVAYEVGGLKDELSTVNREIAAEREAIHVLNAEWSLLNDPARLRRLAERYLGLEPVDAKQIQTFDALPYRPVIDAAADASPAPDTEDQP
jgi:cell division protein FtsL